MRALRTWLHACDTTFDDLQSLERAREGEGIACGAYLGRQYTRRLRAALLCSLMRTCCKKSYLSCSQTHGALGL
jgi:hypothetical protein